MLEFTLTHVVQHLVAQNAWVKQELIAHAGKSVCFKVFPFSVTFTILNDGNLAVSSMHTEPEATVTIPPGTGLRMLVNDEVGHQQVQIEGDVALASLMSKVIRNSSWDYEEDLSQLIGDISAHQLASAARRSAQQAKLQSLNLMQMLVEYWQEERPVLAKKSRVAQYMQEVDDLRDAVARLEKRLEKLATQIPEVATDSDQGSVVVND